MKQYLKDLERQRRYERKRERILYRAQQDRLDFRTKVFWEDQVTSMLLGAGLFVLFIGFCMLCTYIFCKITLY